MSFKDETLFTTKISNKNDAFLFSVPCKSTWQSLKYCKQSSVYICYGKLKWPLGLQVGNLWGHKWHGFAAV